jgi:hypothetical protein
MERNELPGPCVTPRARPRRRARAFTLIDLLVGLTFAGITVAAAATVSVAIHQRLVSARRQAEVDVQGKQVVEYLTRHLRVLGGGSIRPHRAVSSRCETAAGTLAGCVGASEQPLRMLSLHSSAPMCAVTAFDVASSTATFAGGATCCLDDWPSAAGVADGFAVVQVPANAGGGWRYRRCNRLGATCACILEPLAGGALDLPPATGVLAPAWVGGNVALGRPVQWRVDVETLALVEESDANGDGTVERDTLAPRVYGMRVLYGFDDDPADGVVERWASEPEPDIAGSLRLVKVGVAVGVEVPRTPASTVTLFDGTTAQAPAGIFLRPVFGSVSLRNLLLFF